jgi:hypothetical protein
MMASRQIKGSRAGILQANNTSGIPGLRLRHRFTRTGLVRFFIEVTWVDGKRRGTSIPVPVDGYMTATLRAIALRQQRAGVEIDLSARTAWARLSRSYLGRRDE